MNKPDAAHAWGMALYAFRELRKQGSFSSHQHGS
jgi:hypothetical protein